DARRGYLSAIHQLRIVVDADQPTPGFLADERAEARFAEVPRERVAARPGHLVNQHHLRPVDRADRVRAVFALARRDATHRWATQVVNDVVGDVAAAVEALVNDDGLLVRLREV